MNAINALAHVPAPNRCPFITRRIREKGQPFRAAGQLRTIDEVKRSRRTIYARERARTMATNLDKASERVRIRVARAFFSVANSAKRRCVDVLARLSPVFFLPSPPAATAGAAPTLPGGMLALSGRPAQQAGRCARSADNARRASRK